MDILGNFKEVRELRQKVIDLESALEAVREKAINREKEFLLSFAAADHDRARFETQLKEQHRVVEELGDDKRILLRNQSLFSKEEWEARAEKASIEKSQDDWADVVGWVDTDRKGLPEWLLNDCKATFKVMRAEGFKEHVQNLGPYMIIADDNGVTVLSDVLAGKGGIARLAPFERDVEAEALPVEALTSHEVGEKSDYDLPRITDEEADYLGVEISDWTDLHFGRKEVAQLLAENPSLAGMIMSWGVSDTGVRDDTLDAVAKFTMDRNWPRHADGLKHEDFVKLIHDGGIQKGLKPVIKDGDPN